MDKIGNGKLLAYPLYSSDSKVEDIVLHATATSLTFLDCKKSAFFSQTDDIIGRTVAIRCIHIISTIDNIFTEEAN